MKNICVVTSSRADYGLLYWTLKELKKSKKIKLKLIVSGMHLSNKHGLTYKEIIKDSFKIDSKVNFPCESSNSNDLIKSLSVALNKYSSSFEKIKPDIILLLGDRYEIFAAAISASISNIPIFHCHGGESTYGSYDEYFRHCITKLSNVHFVSTDNYRKRVIQLGENPKNVYKVGGLGIENINKLKLLDKVKLKKLFSIDFKIKTFVITYHPVTLEPGQSKKHLKEIFKALDFFKDCNLIFTASNSDTLGVDLTKMIKNYISKRKNAHFFFSLGQLKYLSVMKNSDIIIGNSSSGIIEAPSFRIPSINIGSRQLGRDKAVSVIDCIPIKDAIIKSIKKAFSEKFNKKLNKCINPYDSGNSSKKILKILEKFDNKVINHNFFDVKFKL